MTESHMRRAFTALSRITPAAAAVTSIDDLLRLVTERAAALVGVERCSIYMREERANLFRGCVGCSKGSPLPDDFKRWVAGVRRRRGHPRGARDTAPGRRRQRPL